MPQPHSIGLALLAGAMLLGGCGGSSPADDAEFFPVAGNSELPFSEAVRVGKMVSGGIGPETRQALANIAAVLERHGSSMDRVIKCTAMLADIGEWAAMNEVYLTFFPSHRPARSAFATSGLALGARLELECIALR